MKVAWGGLTVLLAAIGLGEGALLHYQDIRDRLVQMMPVPIGGVDLVTASHLSLKSCGGREVSASLLKLPDMTFIDGVPQHQHRWVWIVELRGAASTGVSYCANPSAGKTSVVALIDYATGQLVRVSSPAPGDGGLAITEE
jgi:hypothetical protein